MRAIVRLHSDLQPLNRAQRTTGLRRPQLAPTPSQQAAHLEQARQTISCHSPHIIDPITETSTSKIPFLKFEISDFRFEISNLNFQITLESQISLRRRPCFS